MKPAMFVNSFDPYAERLEDSKRRRRRCIIISTVVAALLLILIVGLAAGLSTKSKNARKDSPAAGELLGNTALGTACNGTAYPQSCLSALSSHPEAARANPQQLVWIGMNVALGEVKESLALVQNVTQVLEAANSASTNLTAMDALGDCSENMYESMDHLSQSLEEFSSLNVRSLRVFSIDDIQTWLSSALTFYTTCFDGLDEVGGYPKQALQAKGEYVEQVLTNALSFFVTFTSVLKKARVIPGVPTRRLLDTEVQLSSNFVDQLSNNFVEEAGSSSFPDWLPAVKRRQLLQMGTSGPNAVVAKDGSGQFISVQEAVDAAPLKSKTMFVIYIKEGIYEESVLVPKATTNLVLVGDGVGRTIIQAHKSVAGGSTTFDSATVAVSGKGFIGRHLTIQNVAGPKGHQAVALRVSADQVAFFKCSFVGYQDTLYAHSNRQFYRDCVISGTVDFIFGNAAAVFQRCDLVARLPDANQRIMITAHGRVSNLQNTGFSFQGCRVSGTPDLEERVVEFPTFLGRPWKDYSRTVFMQSHLGSIINPAGWSEWDGAPSARYKTVFYGEYMNVGAGSFQTRRVNWSTILAHTQANEYTVGKLITGLEWLPKSQITFSNDLNE